MAKTPFPNGTINSVSGRTMVLRGNDIDTDRIIPARFLKCVTFDGLGQQVFADDRSEQDGQHPFDRIEHQGAAILIVNRNFGCGSSREHAPQALKIKNKMGSRPLDLARRAGQKEIVGLIEEYQLESARAAAGGAR